MINLRSTNVHLEGPELDVKQGVVILIVGNRKTLKQHINVQCFSEVTG